MRTAALLFIFTLSVAKAERIGESRLAVGGPPAAPRVLAASDAQVGGWIAGGTAVLAFIAALGAYIRREARAQEPKPERHVSGGPIDVRPVKDCVERHEHASLAERVEKLEGDLRAMELRLGTRLDARFDQLNQERRTSIAGLHHKVEASANDTRRELDTKIDGTHERINALAGQVGVVIGKLDVMLQQGGRAK